MTAIFAEQALLPGGWHANVRIAADGGTIAAVEPDSAARPGDERSGSGSETGTVFGCRCAQCRNDS